MSYYRTLTKILIICFCFTIRLNAIISVVYNLRIAETTKRQVFDPHTPEHPSILAFTLYDQFRKKYSGESETIIAELNSYIHAKPKWYLRLDFAWGRISRKSDDEYFAKIQTDDFLITGGISHSVNKKIRYSVSGLFGIPTHKDFSLEVAQIGYGHLSIGGQLDGAFFYSSSGRHSFRPAARLVHFFPRNAIAEVDNRKKNFKFNFGNLADLFIAHNSRWEKHMLEFGYDLTFLFKASIHPKYDSVPEKINYIRSDFYGAYRYSFTVKNHPSTFMIDLSYAFDHIPKKFGNKRIIGSWASWSIKF